MSDAVRARRCRWSDRSAKKANGALVTMTFVVVPCSDAFAFSSTPQPPTSTSSLFHVDGEKCYGTMMYST